MKNKNNILKKNYNDRKCTIIRKRLNNNNVNKIEHIQNEINNKLTPEQVKALRKIKIQF